MAAIELRGMTKQYGEVTAVDELDLIVESGAIYGFLGPNGAGKSMTINVLLDLITPTAGAASVLGYDAHAFGSSSRSDWRTCDSATVISPDRQFSRSAHSSVKTVSGC